MSSEKSAGGRRPPDGNSGATKFRREQAEAFSKVLRSYLDALKIEQIELAQETGISRQEISMWLSGKKRPPGWLDAGTMAGAIFQRMLRIKRSGERIPAGLLFDNTALAQQFVNAAGFKMNDVYEDQPLWRQLVDVEKQGRVLRVGWFPWGDFARVNNPKFPPGAPNNFVGLSENLCRRLCGLLGVAMEPVPLEVHEMTDRLLNRDVDLLAPLIQLPARKFAFACSQRIPGLSVALSTVIQKRVMEQFPPPQRIPLDKFQVWLVKGGVADVLLPRNSLSEVIEVPTFEEALDAVRQKHIDAATGRFRVFMADSVSCRHATKGGKPEMIELSPELFPASDFYLNRYTLPVAFGVHPNEIRFLSVVNTCLEVMAEDGSELLTPSPSSLGFVEKATQPKR